ncbi:MAG: hypothetical protein GY944_29870, partial [bacterium]|nr:hypothetical protein [bacterium]
VREFRAQPPAWNEGIVNAGSAAASRADPYRAEGWISRPENWLLLDYYDRSGNLSTQRFLEHRGIPASVYGMNEYQETIHLYEDGALELFGRTGIARGIGNEHVLDPFHNLKVERWAKRGRENAYITDNTSSRWWALINYDWLTSPLFGEAISQDNIGGATSRIGESGQGRWSDSNDARFRSYLKNRGRWSRFAKRLEGRSLREAVVERHGELFANLPPYASKETRDDRKAKLAAASVCEDPLVAEYQRFQYIAQLHAFQRHYRENKQIAARRGHAYDVHGNLGAFFVGRIPYPIVLAESTDALWFETPGPSQYDIFEKGWSNAWGTFRLQMSEAMGRGRLVSLFLPRIRKYTPDLQAHEWAEVSAGGGALLENPAR